ncbi:uncharacterized protein N7459_002890 [Penicillium hispanicum]|uniref:uncharacterized protein n=1 Tax=Penicillium hispanicum TaxID=1080232 RepID=UPI00254029AD|nr:uncharacterized protein N7459_002890 [Penicillium hispanicum]KAJ5587125.1 hypothetical protein N7459_002890 [Penicillium hispanicum]
MYLGLRGQSLITAIGFCCGSGFLLLGYDQGVMGGVVGYQKKFDSGTSSGNTFAQVFDNPNSTITGLMVSIYEVGCMFGSIGIIIWGDRIGRRMSLVIGGLIVVLGTILQVSSYSRAQFIVGRIVAGLGNGMNTSTLGIYQSETCPAKNRGKVVTCEGIMAIGGVWISYWLDFGMSYTKSTAQWRFPLAFPAVFALAMSCVAFFMPESPRWLVLKKRDSEAKQVLAALAGKDVSTEDDGVVEVYTAIRQAVDYEVHAGGEFSYRELFTGGDLQNFRRICLCFGIQLMEEMCGINLITYYMSNVFLQIGTSYFMALLLSGVNSTTYFISSFAPIWLIDRFGRKSLLIYGAIGMMCTMLMLTVSLSYGEGHFTAGVFAILSIFLFNIFYSTGGWMATPFLYPSEISTLRIRSKGSAISVLSKWMFNFLVVMISPVAMANIGWRTYIIFIVLNFVFIFVLWFFYPETKGLALEQVDKIFESGDSITRGAMHHPRLQTSGFGQVLPEKNDPNAGHVEDITRDAKV